jgi:hypothetical protein
MDASQNLLPSNHMKSSRGIVLSVETNLHNIVLVCLFCKISIFHAWIIPRFCNNKAVDNCEAREKAIGI